MLLQSGRPGAAVGPGFPGRARPKGESRWGGGFGGNRTATRPSSAGRQRDEGLRVGSLSVGFGDNGTASFSRNMVAAHSIHRGVTDVPTKGRSRPRRAKAEELAREPVRPVTPVLEIARAQPGATRGSGQAFPLPRSSWNAKMSRPSSAEGAGRRSSRMEPDTMLYLRSSDWEPSQLPPEPEPEPPSCVQPTGRVYVAASVEAQRAHDLAKIQAKYSGSSEQTGAGLAAPESKSQVGGQEQQLLCAKHRELAAESEAHSTGANSRTRSMGFLFCGDCFALQAARKQEQAEEERQKQKQQHVSGEHETSMAGSSTTRLAAEMRFGKSISDRMLGSIDGDTAHAPSPSPDHRRSSTPQPARGMARGQAGCWESADRDQVHHYHYR